MITVCVLGAVLYLKGSQAQFDVQPGCYSSVFRQKGKYSVVHPKQRNEEKGGFSQPPEAKAMKVGRKN